MKSDSVIAKFTFVTSTKIRGFGVRIFDSSISTKDMKIMLTEKYKYVNVVIKEVRPLMSRDDFYGDSND